MNSASLCNHRIFKLNVILSAAKDLVILSEAKDLLVILSEAKDLVILSARHPERSEGPQRHSERSEEPQVCKITLYMSGTRALGVDKIKRAESGEPC